MTIAEFLSDIMIFLYAFFACAVVASRRRARRWSSPPAPRRARAPAASTPHAHDAASFRNLAAPARTDDRRTVTIGLKRHYPARGRVSAGWRPRSGFNNAVPSMAGSLEVVRLGLGWDPLMGRRLGPSADEQRASLCARARARCQWRQLANYTGRLHPIADVGHP